MNKNTRKAHVLQSDESFLIIEPVDLKEGMVFKLFEADGTPVEGLYSDLFLALGDSYLDENGVVMLDVEMLGEPKDEHFIDYEDV